MTFKAQRLGKFIEARAAASEILRGEGVKTRSVSFEEALLMQAASHILSIRDSFYGLEIIRMVDSTSGAIYPVLNRFENVYGVTLSSLEDIEFASAQDRPPRREYQATELGQTVFGLFTPEK